ncbi:MAG: hypothetical protein ACKVJE_17215 [Pseudomonadales bacterium]
MATQLQNLLPDLDGGVFDQKVAATLSEIGLAVVNTGKVGKLTIELDIKQIGTSSQVTIGHTIKSSRPTKRGKVTEEDKTETPVHVGRTGDMSIFPEDQLDLIPRKSRENA